MEKHAIRERFKFLNLTYESVHLGVLLAIVGGFLDAYTYIGRDGVFATAQTGNMVLLGAGLAKGEWAQALLHVPPIIAFVLGVVVAETLKHPRIVQLLRDASRAVLLLEIVVLAIVGLLPPSVPNMAVSIIIAFVASVQISSFTKLIKWSYNTTVTTGNLRTAAQAAYLAIFKHDTEARQRCIGFFTIIASFCFGALISTLATLQLGARSIWIAAAVLTYALLFFSSNSRKSVSKG